PDTSCEPATLPVAQEQVPGQLAGMRILLAEDNEVNQILAREILQKAGCSLVLAENGREAIRAAMAQPFDAILMDCQMPEVDGLEATAEIRKAEAQGDLPRGGPDHLPIIALT